jgi:hypothetical protein
VAWSIENGRAERISFEIIYDKTNWIKLEQRYKIESLIQIGFSQINA